MGKINKNDLYIDYSVLGNALWYAEYDIDNENCILVAAYKSELWDMLFPLVKVTNDSVRSKALLKEQRKKWLEQELQSNTIPHLDINKYKELFEQLKNIFEPAGPSVVIQRNSENSEFRPVSL